MFDRKTDSATVPINRRARFRREADAENDSLARLIAEIPEAVLCFDGKWVVSYANTEAIRISGIQPIDIHSKTYWEIFPDTLGTELERLFHETMHTRVAQRGEYFSKRVDAWFDVHVLPTDDGVSLYYRDITARKQRRRPSRPRRQPAPRDLRRLCRFDRLHRPQLELHLCQPCFPLHPQG